MVVEEEELLDQMVHRITVEMLVLELLKGNKVQVTVQLLLDNLEEETPVLPMVVAVVADIMEEVLVAIKNHLIWVAAAVDLVILLELYPKVY
jgi:hypothetical protein